MVTVNETMAFTIDNNKIDKMYETNLLLNDRVNSNNFSL